MQQRTVIHQIEITASAALQVRLEKQFVDDAGRVIGYPEARYHRLVVEPDIPADDQFAEVNRHLKAMGCEPVAPNGVARVRGVADLVQTPAVRAAWAALRTAHAEIQRTEKALLQAGRGPGQAAAVAARDKAIADAEARYRDIVDTVRRG